MRVCLTGGGTGGHIYPALAIARGLQESVPGVRLLYVGTRRGLEADLVPREGLDFATITVQGMPRRLSPSLLGWALGAGRGLGEAYRIVRRFRPDVVVGTGGYVCGPVVLAAALQRRPIVLHEQNALPGVTNRALARFARTVCLTFPEAARYFPRRSHIVVTGLPVRPAVLAARREDGLKALGLAPDRLTVLVVGGSQGARALNRALRLTWRRVAAREDVQLVHVSGPAGYAETRQAALAEGIDPSGGGNITVMPYLYQMGEALAAADVVVGRAGAAFLAEVTVRGLPAILVPYPHATGNHQEHNARALERAGAAVVIPERELTGERLWEALAGVLDDAGRRRQMAECSLALGKPEALDRILAEVRRCTRPT